MNHGRTLTVISTGPLIMLRLPKPEPKWRDVLRAFNGVRKEHNIKWKEVWALEDADLSQEVTDRAFAGDEGALSAFRLYDWCDGRFVLARAATRLEGAPTRPA